jgi:UDP-sugar pyrophosphorylase
MTGTLKKWHDEGKKWIIFFQDTNALAFKAFPALLGVSKKFNLEMNSIAVPRKPGEAVGAICLLKNEQGQSLTVNVEYNQIESLFKAQNISEPVDERGFSMYPGNINIIAYSVPEYYQTLEETKGNITEFINPKYADSTKTKFKSATRLECMMQDYPKLLKSGERVGITQLDRSFCFSAVKNDLKTAAVKAK